MTVSSPSERQRTFVVPELERGAIVVSGPDAKSWLNGLLTCDVATVTGEHGALGLLLNKTGKIQTDLYLVDAGERLYLSVAKGLASDIAQTLDRFLVMEDAELSEQSNAFAWFLVYGPSALEAAKSVASESAGFAALLKPCADVAALVVPRDEAPNVSGRFTTRDVQVADAERARLLRIERSLFEFGIDFSSSDNPHEAALDRRAVSWTKGCYLGQEVVCMQDMRGKVKRRLTALALDSSEAPPKGSAVVSGAEQVGEVTSSAHGDQTLVAARLKSPYFEGADGLSIAGIPARIVETGSSG